MNSSTLLFTQPARMLQGVELGTVRVEHSPLGCREAACCTPLPTNHLCRPPDEQECAATSPGPQLALLGLL